MSTSDSNVMNTRWGYLLIEELLRCGIDYFCISPGSRSTPLTAAAARNSKARTIVCLDERAAAFHALGYARATGRPAALICTSGTAVANYLPAVVEAAQNRVPLLLLTADRPPELRQCGANQSIDQVGIYGAYLRWQVDMPCPDPAISPQMPLTTIDQAVYRSSAAPAGPVQINCMFREPLAPVETDSESLEPDEARGWRDSGRVHTNYVLPTKRPPQRELEALAKVINIEDRGVITVGRLPTDRDRAFLVRLADKLNWPLFPDIQSGLRLGELSQTTIHHFECLLRSDRFFAEYRPRTILHFGDQLTSKRFYGLLAELPPERVIVVKDHAERHDPTHNITHRFEADVAELCESLMPLVNHNFPGPWLQTYKQASEKVARLLEGNSKPDAACDEISVAGIISAQIPRDHALFLSGSMPIRDMDVFAAAGGMPATVAANRGASGIDGILASACGFAVGNRSALTLVIGDIALIHDLNSLLLAASIDRKMIIVVLNNYGGGIFSFLPIAEHEDIFETYFGTPHDIDFEAAARMATLSYMRPQSNAEFSDAYKKAIRGETSVLIELRGDRVQNEVLHRELHARLQQSIEEMLP